MTRVLVCGPSVFDDPTFAFKALCQVDSVFGPISCVVHNNHAQALNWQQWAGRKRPVKHLPVTEDHQRDGVAAGERCRDRMFAARPDIVVVFEVMPDKDDTGKINPTHRRSKSELIALRASGLAIPVIRFTFDHIAAKLKNYAGPVLVMPSHPAEPSEELPAAPSAAVRPSQAARP